MRVYKDIAKTYLTSQLKPWRTAHSYTQEVVAEKLRMSCRSYTELERGGCGFSATTLLLFLALLSDEEMVKLVREFFQVVLQTEAQKSA